MLNECASARGGAAWGGGLSLETVWHVRADAQYDVTRSWLAPRCLLAVRTLAGQGHLHGGPGGPLEVGAGSLVLVENQRLERYHAAGDTWHFWWFEFVPGGAPFFPLHVRLDVPGWDGEEARMREVFTALRGRSASRRSLASAGLVYLLHRWMADAREQRVRAPHQAAVDRVVEGMHARPDGRWAVGAMARTAGLGERRFRHVFAAATGQSPKRFYDGTRLELGRQFLLASSSKLAVIAEQLGFSSAFHFSRAFRRRFGYPPSAVRLRGAADGRGRGSGRA